jgi:hypothetical protein
MAGLLSLVLPTLCCYDFLYVFKGARSAPDLRLAADLRLRPARPRLLRARRSSARHRPGPNRGTVTRRAPSAALRPCRATAASART